MSNLLIKERLVMFFCWVSSLFFLSIGLYAFSYSVSSFSMLIMCTGFSLTLFSAGLTPKLFFMPLSLTLKKVQSPILFKTETQQLITLIGMLMAGVGVAIKLLP